MSVAFDHRDRGTAETDWTAGAPWAAAPSMSLDVDRVVVVAAHPDDETLGAAGLIAAATARGIPVSVLVLTDGEGSHPDDPEIGARRRRECLAAIDALGRVPVRFAGLPDGGLREHARQVHDAIATVIDDGGGERVLLAVPWWGDGHRDHRVTGETALRLGGDGVRVVGYPIWMWHWGDPAGCDARAWRTLPLDAGAQRSKRAALAAHESQLSGPVPVLHDDMLAHFTRPFEVFIDSPAPPPARTHTPEWFASFYERHDDPWGFASSWYEERKRALLVSALPRRRYRHALELGCATGLLTELLAARADRLTAVDVVDDALRQARERVPSAAVTFLRRNTPEQWPEGRYDLVVLSELGYYWTPDELDRVLRRIHDSLTRDGQLLACHWRAPIDGCTLDGDDVHAAIARSGLFQRTAHHLEDAFVLDVFSRSDDSSVDPAASGGGSPSAGHPEEDGR